MRITKKIVYYSTRKLSKWDVCTLQGSFDLENGLDWLSGKTVCIDKVLMDLHESFGIFNIEISITQKMVCYSPLKSSKWGVCVSGLVWPWKLVGAAIKTNRMIIQVLYELSQNFLEFWRRNLDHPKMVCYSTWKSSKSGYARFRASLTFKMGRTGREGQPATQTRSWRMSMKKFAFLTS